MRLKRNLDRIFILITVFTLAFVFAFMANRDNSTSFAVDESGVYEEAEEHFVTFYDDGEKLVVKTDAETVKEAIERADIIIDSADIVEPSLDTEIEGKNFYINIHRARPAVVVDGTTKKYVMTASFDAKTIATEAGLTIYDGDVVTETANANFLEYGAADVYTVTRNGGQEVTVREEIAFEEQEVKDYALEVGTREVRQLGEVGEKEIVYEIQYVDGAEVSREAVSETVTKEPVARVVAVGAKTAVSPEQETCASWIREAGVSESDLTYALLIIYHESGCRVNATNSYSGAYGIPQALPGSKMASAGSDWENNPITQIRWMANYVKKYGGWAGAWNFWQANGWY